MLKRILSICSVALLASSIYGASWVGHVSRSDQILDDESEPDHLFELGFIPSSRLDGYGSTAQMEIGVECNDLLYYRGFLWADADVDFKTKIILFPDSADLQLPDQLASIALDIGLTWRYMDGNSIQVRAQPGFYSDTEEFGGEAFSTPFSASIIKTVSRDLSGIMGLWLRPDFARELMPIIGLEWEPSDSLSVSAQLPESRLIWYLAKDWSVHAGFEWYNTSFSLREKSSYRREQVTVEDFRTTFGVSYVTSDRLRATVDLGRISGRSLEFKTPASGQPAEIDVESARFIQFGLGLMF